MTLLTLGRLHFVDGKAAKYRLSEMKYNELASKVSSTFHGSWCQQENL